MPFTIKFVRRGEVGDVFFEGVLLMFLLGAVDSVRAACACGGGWGVLMKYMPLENVAVATMWFGLVLVLMTLACWGVKTTVPH